MLDVDLDPAGSFFVMKFDLYSEIDSGCTTDDDMEGMNHIYGQVDPYLWNVKV